MGVGRGRGGTTGGLALAAMLLVGGPVFGAEEASAAGSVKVVQGVAWVERPGARTPATPGVRVWPGDVLWTEGGALLGVTFRDGTRLTLGADSRVAVDEYVFSPADGRFASVFRVARGVIAYISGKLAELAPEAVRVETPVAALGIRGTRFVAEVEGGDDRAPRR